MMLSPKKIAAFAAVLVVTVNLARADGLDLDSRVNNLILRVQAKIDAGKTNESDYQAELAALNGLIAAQDSSDTNVIADLLYKRADLYLVALKDREKSGQYFRELSQKYPTYRLAGVAADRAEEMRVEIERARIRDALAPGTAFPDFAQADLDGKPLSVSNYIGKIVFVDFWATWCPRCMIEIPSIIKMYQADHSQGLEIIGVTLDKTEERPKLDAYLKKNPGMKWPEYYDGLYWDNKLAVKYGIEETPWNVLIGRDGKIIGTNLHGDDLKNAIAKALKAK